jgi:hypothetical protein
MLCSGFEGRGTSLAGVSRTSKKGSDGTSTLRRGRSGTRHSRAERGQDREITTRRLTVSVDRQWRVGFAENMNVTCAGSEQKDRRVDIGLSLLPCDLMWCAAARAFQCLGRVPASHDVACRAQSDHVHT